jgi:hypothetical protein
LAFQLSSYSNQMTTTTFDGKPWNQSLFYNCLFIFFLFMWSLNSWIIEFFIFYFNINRINLFFLFSSFDYSL